MKLLEGKSVAMTGGGGGLGRCYGLAMAKAGAAVAVADINLDAAKATTDAILKAGGRAIAVLQIAEAGSYRIQVVSGAAGPGGAGQWRRQGGAGAAGLR